jgi:hypothetical protein
MIDLSTITPRGYFDFDFDLEKIFGPTQESFSFEFENFFSKRDKKREREKFFYKDASMFMISCHVMKDDVDHLYDDDDDG